MRRSPFVAGGGARSLPIEGIANLAPKWSPDGRRLAFTIQRRGERVLAEINTDGTGLRELRDVQLRPDLNHNRDRLSAAFSKDAQSPIQIGRGDEAEHLQLAAIHL